MVGFNEYDLHTHQHRFASWCAATAAGRSPICRFKVKLGVNIIEESRFKETFAGYNNLPSSQAEFDCFHRKICCDILCNSKKFKNELNGIKGEFTYGIAAKLLNCYLKAIYLSSFQVKSGDYKKLHYIHPPIDRILLQNCKKHHPQAFSNINDFSWSKFEEDGYKKVIEIIKSVMKNDPLWKIEYYWDGFSK